MKRLSALALALATGTTLAACSGSSQASLPTPGPRVESKPTAIAVTPKFSNLKFLKADWASYHNRETQITVTVEPSDYFNYGYGTFDCPQCDTTHYSFRLRDDKFNWIHGYAPRNEFRDLFMHVVENDGKATLKLTVTTDASHGDSGIWTITSWEKI